MPRSHAIDSDIVCTDHPDTDCQLSSFMPVTWGETKQLLCHCRTHANL